MSNNNQVGGDHYQDLSYQPIDLIEDLGLGFMLGSAIKYVCRFDKKGGNEDLLKAIDYLERYKQRNQKLHITYTHSLQMLARNFLSQLQGFQYDAIFEILSGQIDIAISVIKAQMNGVLSEGEKIDLIKEVIHYPGCWDTINFPTLLDAIKEINSGCHEHHCPKKQEDSDKAAAKQAKREVDQIVFGDK